MPFGIKKLAAILFTKKKFFFEFRFLMVKSFALSAVSKLQRPGCPTKNT